MDKSSGENRDEYLSSPRLPRDSLLKNSLVQAARSLPLCKLEKYTHPILHYPQM